MVKILNVCEWLNKEDGEKQFRWLVGTWGVRRIMDNRFITIYEKVGYKFEQSEINCFEEDMIHVTLYNGRICEINQLRFLDD